MSFRSPASTYVVPAHQREVDAMMAEIRAAAAAAPSSANGGKASPPARLPETPRPPASSDPIDCRIAEELEAIRRRLGQIGDVLVGDPVLLHRHATPLQGIDLTNQVLEDLALVIKAADRMAGVEAVRMDDLRARLKHGDTGR